MSRSGKIAKNTLLMYMRMIVVMIVNLFTVRVVFRALGIEDYGIYNAVAGIIMMLSCVSTVLSSATQRFYSYNLGKSDEMSLRDVFSASIIIYSLLALVVVLIGESIGIWFLNEKMVIPESRMVAANWIYQFSILSFVISLLQVPYSAAVVAREELGFFALVSTLDSVMRLLFALFISSIPFDSLIVYGGILLFIHVIVFLSFFVYSVIRFPECHYQKVSSPCIFKDILSFSGWSFFGSVAGVGIMQVNTLLVNFFFGPIVNAARAVSLQIYSALSVFCGSFVTAVKPPMVKAYAEDNQEYLESLFGFSNKFILYCMSIVCIPLFFEMPYVLDVWLDLKDSDTILFSRLIIIYTLFLSLHEPITILMQASNHVKTYHLCVDSFTLLCVPLTYFFYRTGYPAEFTFYVMIAIIIIAHAIRLICLKKFFPSFSLMIYCMKFLFPAFLIILITGGLVFFIHSFLPYGWSRLFCVVFFSVILVLTLVYIVGLNQKERCFCLEMVNRIKKSILRNE